MDDNLIERRRAEIESARIAASHEWWRSEANAELRKSCACGWAHYIWDAALDSAVVELPVRAECGGEALDLCRDAIERAGLRVKS
ncbi:hypothetical protein [Metapseudomonas otitidis]|uniref:hypothetical protein n=1 Tax=Metapseudomonas otitidis TaxID=319939 RepID=UPI002448B820|nr:hypothetical protein [Pseudomonas otitidis]MDH0335141.1 hypothetical protein [Pseudomonas otitidis]